MNSLDVAWRNGRAYYLRRASCLVGEHDAEDVLSIAVIQTLLKGDEVKHPSAFLGCAVGFEGLGFRRKKAIKTSREIPAIEDAPEYEENILDMFDPERLTIASELVESITKEMGSLDENLRQALELATEGVSYREIGKRLGFSVGKAHGIVKKARGLILSRLGFEHVSEVFQ